MIMHLRDYVITLVYIPGKEMVIRDTLNRANYDVDIVNVDAELDPMAVYENKFLNSTELIWNNF